MEAAALNPLYYLIQLGFVGVFIWFVTQRDKADREHRETMTKEEREFRKEESDRNRSAMEDERKFRKEQSESNLLAMTQMAGEVKANTKAMTKNSAIILCTYASNVKNGDAPNIKQVMEILGDK